MADLAEVIERLRNDTREAYPRRGWRGTRGVRRDLWTLLQSLPNPSPQPRSDKEGGGS